MTTGPDRKVVFALLGIAALCLIGLGASLYRAKGTELTNLHNQLDQKETQLEEVRVKLAKQPELEAEYARLQARLAVLEPALPDSAYMPTFLRQIERLAAATNNRIVMIRPKAKTGTKAAATANINNETGEIIPAKAGGEEDAQAKDDKAAAEVVLPYDYSSIDLKIDGTYTTIIDFLQELQRFPKMIAVNDIGFAPKQSGKDVKRSPELTATMGLTAVVTKGGKDGTSE